jgi:hypothetical protein
MTYDQDQDYMATASVAEIQDMLLAKAVSLTKKALDEEPEYPRFSDEELEKADTDYDKFVDINS